MDLASATDQLYAGSPGDFIERRKALVAGARAAKDRPLATAIGRLRRPTRSAWLVNLLARSRPVELIGLLDLGAALQTAQEQMSAPDLRRLSAERHQAIAAATRSAVELGAAHGYTATEAVRQEVIDTLQAALADPGIAEQVRTGTVTEAQTYGGFGPFGLSPAPAPAPAPVAAPASAPASGTEPAEPEDDSEQVRAAAEQRLLAAEAALSEAADRADDADARADELAARVESLRSELAEAEAAESHARGLARSAQEAVAELESAAAAARRAYEAL